MAEHTPGALFVGAQNDILYILSEKPCLSGTDIPPDDVMHPDQRVIATIANLPWAEQNAYGNLFAAAPDLLAACEAVLPYFEVFESAAKKPGATWVAHSEITNAKLLRAALAKAREQS